jgi:uncharacterized protein YciI
MSRPNEGVRQYFLYKLIPSRQTFAQSMTEAEGAIMQRHVSYWSRLFANGAGSVVAFGPVADPNGGYGIAIVDAESRADVERLVQGDPAIQSNAGFRSEIYAMPRAFARSADSSRGDEGHE